MSGEIIGVGVTESSGSKRALEWAIDRATARHSRLRLVSVIGTGSGIAGEKRLLRRAEATTEELLEAAAARARTFDLDVTTLVDRGDPVHRLVDVSERVDLLVIGSDVADGASGGVRGPRGVRIAAAAHCPVVVVPDVSMGGRSGVVVGVDGSATSEKAIEFAAAEADRLGDALTAVMTWSPVPLPFEMESYPEDYLVHMQQLTEEALSISLAGISQRYPDLAVHTRVLSGFPAEEIARSARQARLVAVGSHGRGAVARFLLGSTSGSLIERLPSVTAVIR